MKKSIPTLIFDLDDTLLGSAGIYRKCLSEIGIDPDGDAYVSARKRVKDRLPPLSASARNRLLYFKDLQTQEKNFSASTVLSQMDEYEKALESHFVKNWGVLKRAALFRELSSRYFCALVTNENTRTQLIKIRAIDPDGSFFKAVLTSEEVGVEKPDLKIFKELKEQFGIDFKNGLMIGNDPDTDLAPAHALGMRTVLTTEFSPSPKSSFSPDFAIAHLDDLPELLKGLS
jgi:putative hydrolase of the HAD superfamily